MSTIRLLTILCVFMLFSCKEEEKDTAFKIYHLKPNRVHLNAERVTVNGWYAKTRNDFFVVKNYDINNEQHKIKIDSFVVSYMRRDSFLIANKNANWKLTFFKYGNGVNENTKHEYDTDYTIHNLFSYKKEIASFYFNTRVGYDATNYNTTPEKFHQSKREIISNYFTKINLRLEKREGFTDRLTAVSKSQDTIKVRAKFIRQGNKDEIQFSYYLVLKTLQGEVSNDTISLAHYPNKAPIISDGNIVLTFLEFDVFLGIKDHYYFPEYDGVTWSEKK